MSTNQNSHTQVCFIDYIPAELRENKRWEIIYYVRDPFENKLKRKAVRVRPLQKITERRKLGKRMVLEINKKLSNNWNPFYHGEDAKSFQSLEHACKLFVARIELKLKRDELRFDTVRSYKSMVNNILEFLKITDRSDLFCIGFNKNIVCEFLDYIYYQKQNSGRTHNNYLNFIKVLSTWLIDQGFITENPALKIERVREQPKKRIVIPDDDLKIMFNYLKNKNEEYYLLCLVCYYCLIRRTEMTKLKVKDVFLKNEIIYVEGGDSKNKKSQPVTIPNTLLPLLANHINGANQRDYLFSANFLPGLTQLKPKKITSTWIKAIAELNMPKEYQWYSLKDTGITNLLMADTPLIAVRDQARHSDIKQTAAYTPKQILKANSSIKSASITG